MDRLRARSKMGEKVPAARPSTKRDFSFPFKMLGRIKKSHEEPEPGVDVSTSLPPTSHTDFRTSTVMKELSARFSLLRERESTTKNSPNAKDDNALYTERPSQIISREQCHCQDDERGSPKRPATGHGRIEGRQAETRNGESIMNRGRTTERNNLFGGRQKVTIIPSSGSCGRALYSDDIAPSAFQRSRQQEKERIAAEGKESEHASMDPTASPYSQDSPPVPSIKHLEHGLPRKQGHNSTFYHSRTDTLPTGIQTTGLNNPPQRNAGKTVRAKASAPSLHSFPPRGLGNPPPTPAEISPTVLEKKKIQRSPPMAPLSATVGDPNNDSLGLKKNHKFAALGLQPRPTLKYDEEEYVRRQAQRENRIATATPARGIDTNTKQINRRSRSFPGLQNVQIDRSSSTLQYKSTVEGEFLSRACFQRMERGKNSMVEATCLALSQRSGPAVAASSGTGRSSSRVHHPTISPSSRMPNQTCVSSIATLEKTPYRSRLSEPQAFLEKVDNNLWRETSAGPSKNELRLQQSASKPDENDNIRPKIPNLASDSWSLKNNDRDDIFVTPFETPSTDAPNFAVNNPRVSDDFARHLSDGAQRIREKMAMHAESDHSSPPSERPIGYGSDLPPARSGVFNALRSKTSNGTLSSRRLLSGSSTSSVAVSIPYESSSKTMARNPSGPKSAATQSFSPLYSES